MIRPFSASAHPKLRPVMFRFDFSSTTPIHLLIDLFPWFSVLFLTLFRNNVWERGSWIEYNCIIKITVT
jgi:hypothetical protein